MFLGYEIHTLPKKGTQKYTFETDVQMFAIKFLMLCRKNAQYYTPNSKC